MDVATGKRVVRLRERIVKNFRQGDWEAIGLLTGQAALVDEHPRLLRSLSFRDDDYEGNALTVLRTMVEADPAAADVVEEYLDDHYPAEAVPGRSSSPAAVAALEDDSPAPASSDEYDVALSFAGEDRAYVERVAARLKDAGVRVFYDAYEKATLWGTNLADHLADVYGKRSRFVVMFVSKHYAGKAWTTHERQNAQARAIREQKVVVLPARFDDTEVPGLPSTVGYVDLNTTSVEELVDLILKKLARATGSAPLGAPSSTSPDVVAKRGKRIFSLAVGLLRATSGRMFKTSDGATSGLPGTLWYGKNRDWEKIVDRLGDVERQRGRFRPFVEPSLFDGSDEALVSAAVEILRLYLWASENHPDFDRIRLAFDLPPVDEVRKLLTTPAVPNKTR